MNKKTDDTRTKAPKRREAEAAPGGPGARGAGDRPHAGPQDALRLAAPATLWVARNERRHEMTPGTLARREDTMRTDTMRQDTMRTDTRKAKENPSRTPTDPVNRGKSPLAIFIRFLRAIRDFAAFTDSVRAYSESPEGEL